MYAEGSCSSDVPFYDMCSTQLHVSLFVFHFLVLLEGILLGECILLEERIPLEALLLGSFPHFQRPFLVSFLWRCPWHLDWLTDGSVPILLAGSVGYLPLTHNDLP